MEFKVDDDELYLAVLLVLIESDWNLKSAKAHKAINRIKVLIESDWNLKEDFLFHNENLAEVLIESDWNLKNTFMPEESARS